MFTTTHSVHKVEKYKSVTRNTRVLFNFDYLSTIQVNGYDTTGPWLTNITNITTITSKSMKVRAMLHEATADKNILMESERNIINNVVPFR